MIDYMYHIREYRAAYYGDCYDKEPSISMKRKSCMMQLGKRNTNVLIILIISTTRMLHLQKTFHSKRYIRNVFK